eukprot:TRINITY_DN11854_c0_g1_i4.p1 TRINITY_DN11854_c0_g1~~TRINITY_DN11854_c0_g1_i4.p1  ORF type:complete len:121 (+),score=63.43 TRINITY_DN11854_c0_g1_i4:66-428(+)
MLFYCFTSLFNYCSGDGWCALSFFFFFFKQKTAYEMQRGLVGSEMCIRDRYQRRVHGIIKKTHKKTVRTVSYTHLTLPTILLVQISVVAVSLKKKKKTHQKTEAKAKKKKKRTTQSEQND